MTGNTPGCHAAHARHYIRRVQVNKDEQCNKIYQEYNPKAIAESVWSSSKTDNVISFPITINEDTILKKDVTAIDHLEYVANLQEFWVKQGNNYPEQNIEHNVSVTVLVKDDEWDSVKKHIWNNRSHYSGISLLPAIGDLIYNQPAYSEVLMPEELLNVYGSGVMFTSGLIVDIIDTFGDVWKACDVMQSKGEKLYTDVNAIQQYITTNIDCPIDIPGIDCKKVSSFINENRRNMDIVVELFRQQLDNKLFDTVENLALKRDIVRRIHKFCDKYFKGDLELTINAIKHVQLYHDWCTLKLTYQPIDWTSVKWEYSDTEIDTLAASNCAGGACEITKI